MIAEEQMIRKILNELKDWVGYNKEYLFIVVILIVLSIVAFISNK